VDAESKAATCKEDGVLVMRCDACGDTQTSVVSKLTVPHSYEVTEELKATCVADGYKKETCSVCGLKEIFSIGSRGVILDVNGTINIAFFLYK